MSILSKLLPNSKYIRAMYWLCLTSALGPHAYNFLLQVKEGSVSLESGIDWAVLTVSILITAAGTTAAYAERYTEIK